VNREIVVVVMPPIHEAAQRGDLEEVMRLVEEDRQVSICASSICTNYYYYYHHHPSFLIRIILLLII